MANTMADGLVARWRQRAGEWERFGLNEAATLLSTCADELEREAAASDERLVSVNDAVIISGYSADHLGRLRREGKLQNYGSAHHPRYRVGELPRKPATLTRARRGGTFSAKERASHNPSPAGSK